MRARWRSAVTSLRHASACSSGASLSFALKHSGGVRHFAAVGSDSLGPRVAYAGESALLLRFGTKIDVEVNKRFEHESWNPRRRWTSGPYDSGESGAILGPLVGLFPPKTLGYSLKDALAPVPSQFVDSLVTRCYLKAAPLQQQYDLTKEEAASISCYTAQLAEKEASPYWACNKCLRSERRPDIKPWVAFTWLLLCAMSKLPPADYTTVFRGMKQSIEQLGSNWSSIGNTVVFNGFTSCATALNVMSEFVGTDGPRVLLLLRLTKKGRSFKDFSFFPTEAEIVLPPCSTFVIEDRLDLGNGLTQLILQQVNSVEEILPMAE